VASTTDVVLEIVFALGGRRVLSAGVATTAVVLIALVILGYFAATHAGIPALGGWRVLSARVATTAVVLLALVTLSSFAATAVDLDICLALGGGLPRRIRSIGPSASLCIEGSFCSFSVEIIWRVRDVVILVQRFRVGASAITPKVWERVLGGSQAGQKADDEQTSVEGCGSHFEKWHTIE
jgi:hypothetical protein